MLTWQSSYLEPVVLTLSVTVLYLGYHFGSEAIRKGKLPGGAESEPHRTRRIYLQRLLGAGLLGPVLGTVAFLLLSRPPSTCGLSGGKPLASLLFTAGMAVIVLPMTYLNSRNPQTWKYYPQIRIKMWNLKSILLNSATWGIYLLTYEFCFRGVFLFSLAERLGSWPAIAVMTSVYVLAHLPKGIKECLGVLPGGILFGIAALYTGTIWASFAAHWIIAVGNDFFAVLADPDRSFILRWRKPTV